MPTIRAVISDNRTNANKVRYTGKCLAKIVDQINQKPGRVPIMPYILNGPIPVEMVTGFLQKAKIVAKIENDGSHLEVEVEGTINEDLFKLLQDSSQDRRKGVELVLVKCGSGTSVDEKGVKVIDDDYVLEYVHLLNKSEACNQSARILEIRA